MKKFLSLGFVALVLCSPVSAMESKDVDMSDAQQPIAARVAAPSTFDMSSLQEAINDIAYNGTVNHLSYFDKSQNTDFIREMFKRYSALQSDLIQLQEKMSPADFKQAVVEVNKLMTSIISSEDMLKFTYITVTRKFNSEQDITPEISTVALNCLPCIVPGLNIPSNMPPEFQSALKSIIYQSIKLKSIIYQSIKLNQEKREFLYRLLLTKPHLDEEYKAILRGERSDLSEEFLQELITSSANILEQTLRFSLKIAAQNAHEQIDLEELESMLALIKTEIMSAISSKRTVLPLLLKHFGEISGLGII